MTSTAEMMACRCVNSGYLHLCTTASINSSVGEAYVTSTVGCTAHAECAVNCGDLAGMIRKMIGSKLLMLQQWSACGPHQDGCLLQCCTGLRVYGLADIPVAGGMYDFNSGNDGMQVCQLCISSFV